MKSDLNFEIHNQQCMKNVCNLFDQKQYNDRTNMWESLYGMLLVLWTYI